MLVTDQELSRSQLLQTERTLGRGEIVSPAQHHIHQDRFDQWPGRDNVSGPLSSRKSRPRTSWARAGGDAPFTKLFSKNFLRVLSPPLPNGLVTGYRRMRNISARSRRSAASQTPEHHESDGVARVLGRFIMPGAAFVELPAAFPERKKR